MNEQLLQTLLTMPLRERVRIMGDIWDSIADEDIPTAPGLRRKIRSRLAKYQANRNDVMTLDQFRKKARDLMKQFERRRRRSA